MNKVNYQALIMMLADAPRLKTEETDDKTEQEEAEDIVGIFKSKLG